MSVFGVFLVSIFPYSQTLRISPFSVRMREHKDQKKLRIRILFTQYKLCFILYISSKSVWIYVWWTVNEPYNTIKSENEVFQSLYTSLLASSCNLLILLMALLQQNLSLLSIVMPESLTSILSQILSLPILFQMCLYYV